MMPDLEVGQAGKRRGVRSDDRPSRCHGGRGDQQIVSSTRRALAAHLDEQARMSLSDGNVVGDHWDGREHVLDERCPRSHLLPCSEQRTNPQLGDRDRRNRDVIRICDHLIERVTRAVGVDEERRVEQEPSQDRSSISTN